MTTLIVRGPARLSGTAQLPPDKSILHRALIFAALGGGESFVAAPILGADNLATLRALAALGVELHEAPDGVRVHGVAHPRGLKPPNAAIDCANSGTTLRILAGVLAGADGRFTLDGDASLRRRPMERLRPLETMGARLHSNEGPLRAPLTIEGARLTGHTHLLEIASAQVKSALLLAGAFADGPTTVVEPRPSRDHTERLLEGLGVTLERPDLYTTIIEPVREPWTAERYDVPPDFSAAAFLITAAVLTNRPELLVDTGVNPSRTGLLDVLVQMGAVLALDPSADVGFEPTARVGVSDLFGGRLTATRVDGDTLLRAIDEVPLIGALATQAQGETTVADAAELRHKESDRLTETVALLRAFGADADETEDGFVVRGPARLSGAKIPASQDHRIAMTAAVLALTADGTTEIEGFEVADVSYPGFVDALRTLGADVETAT
ncbi:MAG: 3-phosphoshikimate 1-carboxyvinyltransferase [Deltaproteobacteria bacterium]